jgi:alkanesulfonate monooxygenase SsuD/methylene tetrahydromethanopterin reductase-like flavin-dependent oxidoreductase (luciferase family)
MSVTFGLILPQRSILFGAMTARQMLDIAQQADREPLFDSLWVGDSLFSKPRPDSIALLGALAGVTTRVTLGVGCMASFPVRDPIVFAYQWATLDLLSGGRTLLTVCTGIVTAEAASQAEGKPWGVVDSQRARRMSENIDICRALWTGQPTSFEGQFYGFDTVTLAPVPVQQPCPIWIASNPNPTDQKTMDNAFRRVARKADGWMSVELFPNSFNLYWHRLQEILAAEGRDPATYPNLAYHNFNINENSNQAYEESQRFLDHYYGPVFTEPMVRSWTAHGSPEQCVEQLRHLKDAGAKRICLRATAWDQATQYRRLVAEVLPHVNDD